MTNERIAERLRRGDVLSAECPSREVLQHVTSRWGVLLLLVLLDGTQRFSELRRKVNGVSEKMLAQTLRWLQEDGFVDRRSFNTVPPHVEYSLTPLGREVAQRVESLADWIEDHIDLLGRVQAPPMDAPVAVPSRLVVKAGQVVGD